MSSSHAPLSPQIRFAPGFSRHSASLQAALPSPDATSLDSDLLRRINRLRKAIEPHSNSELERILAERYCPPLLWDLAQQTGLTLGILEAAGHVAEIDTDGSTTSQLVACINSILEAGLKSKRVSSTSLEVNKKIIQAVVQAIPRVIDESWPKLSSKICSSSTPSADDLALLDGLVHLGCIATELIECGQVAISAHPTESGALQEL
ncbi:hypothetical protein FS837_006922, partial [Tulasnella sp. UAMH 9824]